MESYYSNFVGMVLFPRNIASIGAYFAASHDPLVIAGPCSAESEEQVMQTARELAKIPQVAAFRCGAWKPRTRPGDFEGQGEAALRWLGQVKAELRLQVCVEVGLPSHVEMCLRHGIDALWLGSRTVANPFSVNEIAEALKGVDIPVLVKNPVNPDLQLWIGALERLYHQGIRKLAAVHRGFATFESRPYRNMPFWEIPMELMRRYPALPVLNDPSHIAGDRALVPGVTQTALRLSFSGLMIEAHIDPENALTDKDQQLTPASLAEMLSGLVIPDTRSAPDEELLLHLRQEIDQIDDRLLFLLARRMETASRIGGHKRGKGLDPFQPERWKQVLEDRLIKGNELGLSRDFVLKILQAIHEEALGRQ